MSVCVCVYVYVYVHVYVHVHVYVLFVFCQDGHRIRDSRTSEMTDISTSQNRPQSLADQSEQRRTASRFTTERVHPVRKQHAQKSLPEPRVDTTRVEKGTCGNCGQGVFADEARKRDSRGVYFHTACCPPAQRVTGDGEQCVCVCVCVCARVYVYMYMHIFLLAEMLEGSVSGRGDAGGGGDGSCGSSGMPVSMSINLVS
jgi:hypothetical protein